jgi:thiol:disulfide interchange protein DsbA
MNLRKLLTHAGMLIGIVLCAHAFAAEPVKGKEYILVEPPQPTSSGNKVEVLEFFWYACPHCFNLQPALKSWAKTMPKDVDFKRVPTVFRDSMIVHARMFYTLEAVGALEKLHQDVFHTFHEENRPLNDKQAFLDWAGRKGVDVKKLAEAWDSFTVQTKTQRAVQMTKLYGITGTPSIVVAGKYLTAPSMTVTPSNSIDYDRFTAVINELTAMARKSHSAQK